MIPTLINKIKKSKHSKTLLKLYIVWCVIADVTLLAGIVWGVIHLWFWGKNMKYIIEVMMWSLLIGSYIMPYCAYLEITR